MDVINNLILHILKTNYGDFPKETIHIAKKFLLDSLGTLIAGSSAPGCQEVANQIKEWGGKQEATITTYGIKVPAPNAALINSMMMHARDYDDTHDFSSVHGFAPVLPAIMASSEMTGSISGKEFLTALILGVDIICRIALGMKLYKGWHYSSVCGTFGAIAGAGKIYRLNHNEMLNAIGIVYSLTAGNVQCVRDKGLVKRMQPGFAAQAGLSAIAYAKRGVTGSKNILEGDYGFYKLYDDNGNHEQFIRSQNKNDYGIHKVTHKLGERYEIEYLSMKPYPCCRYTHPAIDGTLEFIKRHNIETRKLVEVKVFASKLIYDAVGKPFEIDEREPQQVNAQFSIPYTVAVSLTKRRRPDICDFEEENIRNGHDVIEMAKKIKVEIDPKLNGRIPETLVFQTDKESYPMTIDYLKGSPENPMTNEECQEKFLGCTRYSIKPMPDHKVHTLIDRTLNIEKLKDVSELMSLLK